MAAPQYQDAIRRRLSIIDGIGSDATRHHAQAMQSRNAAARQQAAYSQARSAPTGGGGPSIPQGGGKDPISFGRYLESLGYKVAEHPEFGNGRVGKHSNGSRHYSGRAFDVNWAPGTSKAEQDKLAEAVRLANQWGGLKSIFMAPGHYGHAHFQW